ncbi:hypothetical protein OIE62_06775 [Streptomyces scopuliridis]|uniref:Uncharacterized protein n=1 Tax=Streptomyces scopuliridis TaxID=452529 RepID=A0ACD4ZU65_9ACTN|nr:hypothetical protein [Streptomyces scopuliridis]WSC01716.1 hypothetical protein OG835_35045 [Streptomyces scopuliridis]WSC04745.1 hypothetical protein OIE62_06775 [Streptomyces scopuliridis]
MAPLTSTVSDTIRIAGTIGMVAARDLEGTAFQAGAHAPGRAEQFAAYGRVPADDLRALCLGVPDDSDVGPREQAAGNESAHRVYALPDNAWRVEGGAQDLTRLVLSFLSGMERTARPHHNRQGG